MDRVAGDHLPRNAKVGSNQTGEKCDALVGRFIYIQDLMGLISRREKERGKEGETFRKKN